MKTDKDFQRFTHARALKAMDMPKKYSSKPVRAKLAKAADKMMFSTKSK